MCFIDFNLVKVNSVTFKIFPTDIAKKIKIGVNISELTQYLSGTENYIKYLNVIKFGKPIFFEDVVFDKKISNQTLNIKAFKVGNGIGMIFQDITESKLAQAKLKESEKKYRPYIAYESGNKKIRQTKRWAIANKGESEASDTGDDVNVSGTGGTGSAKSGQFIRTPSRLHPGDTENTCQLQSRRVDIKLVKNEELIKEYLDLLDRQNSIDSLIPHLDKMIKVSRKTKEMFRFMLVTLFSHYDQSKIMCMDRVYVHIAEKYYINEAYWSDKKQI